MKITSALVSMTGPTVLVSAKLQIQDSSIDLQFTLLESDLYAAANAAGRMSWENFDLVTVAKTKLDLDCTLE
jgi:hypothetical protein